MKLKHKLNILTMAIPAVLFLSVIIVGTLVINQIVYRLNKKILTMELNTITTAIEDRIDTLKSAGVSHILEYNNMAKNEIIDSIKAGKLHAEGDVFIINYSGDILYHPNFEEGIDKQLKLPQEIQLNPKGAFTYNYKEKLQFCVYDSIPEWGWKVFISLGLDQMYAQRNEYIRIVSLISIVLIMGGLSLSYITSMNLVRRIDDSLECVNKVKKGDLSANITVTHTDDEIASMQMGINDMIAKLRETIASLKSEINERTAAEEALKQSKSHLKELNEELEKRVDERTASLEKANKKLQETINQLQKTQSQLVEIEKMNALGGLVTGVAHEINTPAGISLTAASHIEKLTGDIKKSFAQDTIRKTQLKIYLDTIEESSKLVLVNLKRAEKLVQSFKEIAADQWGETPHVFNLKKHLEDTVASLNQIPGDKKITITVDSPDDLNIYSYPGVFYQIIYNLISNSIIHGFDSHQEGAITIKAIAPDNENLRIIVSDNGVGVSKEDLIKIFEPFFTTKRDKGGSGLGLPVVYNLVTHKLGGRIVSESKPGEGISFTINLPIKRL